MNDHWSANEINTLIGSDVVLVLGPWSLVVLNDQISVLWSCSWPWGSSPWSWPLPWRCSPCQGYSKDQSQRHHWNNNYWRNTSSWSTRQLSTQQIPLFQHFVTSLLPSNHFSAVFCAHLPHLHPWSVCSLKAVYWCALIEHECLIVFLKHWS